MLSVCDFMSIRKLIIYCNPFKLVWLFLKLDKKMSSQPKEEGEVLQESETEEELVEEEEPVK